MKERPILFNAPMVRAILGDVKTVTRRPIKPAPLMVTEHGTARWAGAPEDLQRLLEQNGRKCPYGEPGDRLWVREAWAADAQVDSIAPRELSKGEPIVYPADGSVRQTGCAMISQGKGRPSIHMPRWASRILLEITAVRVERLQDISEEQAIGEGCYPIIEEEHTYFANHQPAPAFGRSLEARGAFQILWMSINGAENWDSNPWVWVVEFNRVTP